MVEAKYVQINNEYINLSYIEYFEIKEIRPGYIISIKFVGCVNPKIYNNVNESDMSKFWYAFSEC